MSVSLMKPSLSCGFSTGRGFVFVSTSPGVAPGKASVVASLLLQLAEKSAMAEANSTSAARRAIRRMLDDFCGTLFGRWLVGISVM
jgi:hypothetical protein